MPNRRHLACALIALSCVGAIASLPALAQSGPEAMSETSGTDEGFVRNASAAGAAEIALGKLAAAQGHSDAVKSFGQRMVTDHTAANEELKHAVAGQRGYQIADAPKPEDAQFADELSRLSGKEFDARFAQKMVADHKEAIAIFETESSKGKNPELKAFAAKTLPTLREHAAMAHKLPMR
ncbi:putative membrane protein [Luteibacter sp. Sphag1AF]|uniref:DUF4142 domain-containing protein n=1 Tax=Luteibacter sp. Sphag1AF TaxID=2587031 RepID=UPI00160D906F|nr:DUF4142 domain-containing protein [Luteibacter sp. Sphag1AF]MBB3228555.1 putative membrane protein [Luteibacter sp. Sphag1AF]